MNEYNINGGINKFCKLLYTKVIKMEKINKKKEKRKRRKR